MVQRDTIAAAENVEPATHAQLGSSRPCERESNVVDCAKDLGELRHVDAVRSNELPPHETGLRRAIQERRRAEAEGPVWSHRKDASHKGKTRGRRVGRARSSRNTAEFRRILKEQSRSADSGDRCRRNEAQRIELPYGATCALRSRAHLSCRVAQTLSAERSLRSRAGAYQ